MNINEMPELTDEEKSAAFRSRVTTIMAYRKRFIEGGDEWFPVYAYTLADVKRKVDDYVESVEAPKRHSAREETRAALTKLAGEIIHKADNGTFSSFLNVSKIEAIRTLLLG